jgi:hypothetical protein
MEQEPVPEQVLEHAKEILGKIQSPMDISF